MTAELVIPKGITRHDYERTLGWLARVYRAGKCVRKLFSDGVYGGELPALDAATAWQAAQRQDAPSRIKRTPGYGYVRRTRRHYRLSSGELRGYEAFEVWVWDAEGRPASTSWSIETHGEAVARDRCEAWLAEARLELSSEPLAQAG